MPMVHTDVFSLTVSTGFTEPPISFQAKTIFSTIFSPYNVPMKNESRTSTPAKSLLAPRAAGIIVAIALVAVFTWHHYSPTKQKEDADTKTTNHQPSEPIKNRDKIKSYLRDTPLSPSQNKPSDSTSKPLLSTTDLQPMPEHHSIESSNETQSPKAVSSPQEMATYDIETFYTRLKDKDYIKKEHLPETPQKYFNKLLVMALDHPPIISGEMNDIQSIIKNTTHFYTIFGKYNILLLNSIVTQESDQLEQIINDYYILLKYPSLLLTHFDITLSQNALNDYASFFLNSMGGRLYLFRRNSQLRILVTYYAILLIDTSNSNGTNKNGTDIRPHINALIDDLESSNIHFQFRDTYLDTLYTLQEKYQ